ncbi:trp operon leader peptide [Streptomyces yaizuensis]
MRHPVRRSAVREDWGEDWGRVRRMHALANRQQNRNWWWTAYPAAH